MSEGNKHPDGKISKHDEGQLAISLGIIQGRVVMDFGKSVTWIGGDPDWIDQLCKALQEKAQLARQMLEEHGDPFTKH